MTVVVAFVGADGAVMAADTEATESGHTRYDVDKIWMCGPLLCGYTGNSAVKARLARAMEDVLPDLLGQPGVDRLRVQNVVQELARPVLQHVYSHHVPPRPGSNFSDLGGVLLLLGRDEDGYWLLELDQSNNATFYTEAGFHTVGSGSPAAYVAYALMKNYDVRSKGMPAQRLMAYRTVENCINALGGAFGVGGSVHLWSSEQGEPFTECVGETLEAVRNGVEQWTTIERESLDRASSTEPSKREDVTPPAAIPADAPE